MTISITVAIVAFIIGLIIGFLVGKFRRQLVKAAVTAVADPDAYNPANPLCAHCNQPVPENTVRLYTGHWVCRQHKVEFLERFNSNRPA